MMTSMAGLFAAGTAQSGDAPDYDGGRRRDDRGIAVEKYLKSLREAQGDGKGKK